MAKMKIIRDKDGDIINIGDWDYMKVEDPVDVKVPVERQVPIKLPDGGYMTDATGTVLTKPVVEEEIQQEMKVTINNPLPDGAYEDEAEIVKGWDGGLYEVGDERALAPEHRKNASSTQKADAL